MPPSPKLNARQAKHLEFQAAPVPKFLQSFKEKVQPASRRSEWEETLGVGPARDSRDDGLLLDSDGEGEDEWEGAHVVVLDDKKDLTLEQARQASRIQPPAQGMRPPKSLSAPVASRVLTVCLIKRNLRLTSHGLAPRHMPVSLAPLCGPSAAPRLWVKRTKKAARFCAWRKVARRK